MELRKKLFETHSFSLWILIVSVLRIGKVLLFSVATITVLTHLFFFTKMLIYSMTEDVVFVFSGSLIYSVTD